MVSDERFLAGPAAMEDILVLRRPELDGKLPGLSIFKEKGIEANVLNFLGIRLGDFGNSRRKVENYGQMAVFLGGSTTFQHSKRIQSKKPPPEWETLVVAKMSMSCGHLSTMTPLFPL